MPEEKQPVWRIILALQLFLLLAALDQTVITTAMPRIIEQLGGFDRYSWATTSYLFSSTIAVPVAGNLSDMFGRKKCLLIAVLIFVVASIACGMATSWRGFPIDGMNQLIIYRVLQGVGGGAIVSLSFSVVGDLFPPSERGKYQGYFAAVFALASIIGPTLGGYVADTSSWRWLFLINLPIGLFGGLLFASCFKQRQINGKIQSFDIRGLLLFCVGSSCLLIGVSLPFHGAMPLTNWLLIMATGLLALLFFRVEKDTEQPFLPVNLLGNRIILISIVSLAIYGIGMFGASLLVPLYMQSVRGMSVSSSGVALSPLILTVALSSIIGGQWMTRSGKYKMIVLTGLIMMTFGVFALSQLPEDVALIPLIGTMAFVGFGIGLLLPIYTIVIQNAVKDDLIGTVTGLSQFSRSIGGTLGVACLGSLLTFLYHANLNHLLTWNLPSSVVASLDNPLQPEKLRSNLEQDAALKDKPETIVATVAAARQALYTSIKFIYTIYGAGLASAVLLNLFLEELPLRSTKLETFQEKLEQN
jgi:EmrB/QacA subfamily drug resistance transporter